MKNKLLRIILIALVGVALSIEGFAQSSNENSNKNNYEEVKIHMFPAAKQGYKQFYIHVPNMPNENDFKVEFFAGIEAEVDCNNHFLSGTINEEILEGWGYNYYTVETKGVIGGTMMACPDEKMKKEFIKMPSKEVNYNSKLPIVIYAPENIDVKYRIWVAEPIIMDAKFVK